VSPDPFANSFALCVGCKLRELCDGALQALRRWTFQKLDFRTSRCLFKQAQIGSKLIKVKVPICRARPLMHR
jgi:hypothetical protein